MGDWERGKSDVNNVVNFKVMNVDHYKIDEGTEFNNIRALKSYFNRWKDRR
ncbi:MAG: hypothetical protein IPM38_04275 [Ignavibacteria bacterium]|nr:hypothetical protein [Ignavibacteria bacterium]